MEKLDFLSINCHTSKIHTNIIIIGNAKKDNTGYVNVCKLMVYHTNGKYGRKKKKTCQFQT